MRKLPFLERWNDDRRRAAAWYGQALEGMGDVVLPEVGEASMPVWHVYVVRTADPVGLGTFLRERGVETGRHYPEPIHLSEAYRALGHRPGAFPVAEALARECLSLPMFPGISEDQLERVARAIESWFADG